MSIADHNHAEDRTNVKIFLLFDHPKLQQILLPVDLHEHFDIIL